MPKNQDTTSVKVHKIEASHRRDKLKYLTKKEKEKKLVEANANWERESQHRNN